MAATKEDRRIQRTRGAVHEAFTRLVFEGRRYDRIKVADLIERAGVGRSTFYEHYRNKHDVLAETIRYPFAPLADAVGVGFDIRALRASLLHFREHASQARAIFGGSARRPVARVLAAMIEERLQARAKRRGMTAAIPIRITSIAIADAQLAAISAWLAGEIACDVAVLAQTLSDIAQASAARLCGEDATR